MNSLWQISGKRGRSGRSINGSSHNRSHSRDSITVISSGTNSINIVRNNNNSSSSIEGGVTVDLD